MGIILQCTICCKKKKNQKKKKISEKRRDTKFVSQTFQQVKIEIKNTNDSNSKEIPLINNFLKETLNNPNVKNSLKSNLKNKNKDKKENIQNIVDENIYKGNEIQISENSNKSFKLEENNPQIKKNENIKDIKSEKSKQSKDSFHNSSSITIKTSKSNTINITKNVNNININISNNNKNNNNNNNVNTNNENNQVFIDYKTFIKGKPYNELNKEYKQSFDIDEEGFGNVKSMIHKKTGQLRAMKIIKKIKNFNYEEIENLILLNHPNILKLYEYYYDEENIYIITEYIRGQALFNKIQQKYRFTEEESAVIIKSILQAITFCHSRGIIHRDLKPENILIPTGKKKIDYTLLKIIDFGSSVLKKDDGKMTFRLGTPYYIAPEVLLENYNEKCDVWSIGVILYLLLVGQAPFEGDNDDIICQRIISDKIDFTNSKIKSLSSEAVDFMKKLLEKNPEKRISSSEALEHIWLKKKAPQTKVNKAFSRRIYKNISKFREESQLSTAVTTFITNYLMNDDELKSLKKLFFELDVKGAGVITRDDLFKGMEECFDKKITREEVNKIFGNIDYDNNGTITFDEFVKAAIDKKKILNDQKLKAAFSLFDRNGDGDIEARELKEVIGNENNKGDKVFLEMIEEVDLDGNGVIDFKEFKSMMKKLVS